MAQGFRTQTVDSIPPLVAILVMFLLLFSSSCRLITNIRRAHKDDFRILNDEFQAKSSKVDIHSDSSSLIVSVYTVGGRTPSAFTSVSITACKGELKRTVMTDTGGKYQSMLPSGYYKVKVFDFKGQIERDSVQLFGGYQNVLEFGFGGKIVD